VAYAFPMFMIPVSLVRGCIVFKRGSIADKQVGWLVYVCGRCSIRRLCDLAQGVAQGWLGLHLVSDQATSPCCHPACTCVAQLCGIYIDLWWPLLSSCCVMQGFNAWIDRCVAASPQPGICLFPEGEQ
jgi:hypothetical protein